MILNVDDYEPQRFLRTRLLERAGYSVREAGSAKQARDVIHSETPALVLLDVNLPDTNGLTLCSELKQEIPNVRIVMISATHRASQVQRDAIEAGADAFLAEPVSSEQFLRIIGQLARSEQRPRPVAH
jgi:CheY-like chemotaxis protein